MENFWGVGKWVLIVFITGLIAGFGRLLASWVVKRGKKTPKPAEPRVLTPSSTPSPTDERIQTKAAKQQTKIEKKQAKEELKRRKKT